MPMPLESEVEPRVSVVMSTFNRANMLPAAISRLLAQDTDVPYEVIVVNNNSSDDTEAVLAEARRQHSRLRTAFEPQQGVSYGRNRGIELSRAQVVAFTDDDVVVTRPWVQLIAEMLAARPDVDCVGGRVLPIWSSPPPSWLTRRHWSPLALVEYGDKPFIVDASRPVCLVTANVAYRRPALDAIGWFSGAFPRCQDHELLVRLWASGRRGLYVPSLVAYCEVPRSRLTWTYYRRWYAENGRFCAQIPDGPLAPVTAAAGAEAPLMLFGSPAAIYRQLLASIHSFVVARLTGRRQAALDAELALRQRAAFVGTRARLWRQRRQRRGMILEVSQFLVRWLGRRVLHLNTATPRT